MTFLSSVGQFDHAGDFSRNGTLICEEYIRKTFPYVIGGDIFVVDGKVHFWGLYVLLA